MLRAFARRLAGQPNHPYRRPDTAMLRAFARRLSGQPSHPYRRPDAPFDEATFSPIGVLRSPYLDRFGCPRQAVCVSLVAGDHALHGEQQGVVQLRPDWNLDQAVRDLVGFERIWLITLLHRSSGWRPIVNPPRGGRRGVLSTRSPDRPTPIGLSAVRLIDVQGLNLTVSGIDLLDGTPILDIKPYVPYCDAFPNAKAGWVDELPREDASASTGTLSDYAGMKLNEFQEARLRNRAAEIAALREGGAGSKGKDS